MKRLYKSRKNKVIDGVCGGIAEYFNVDPVLIRLIAVLFFFTGGVTLIAYIVGMIIIPRQPLEGTGESASGQEQVATPPAPMEGAGHAGGLILGVIMILFGVYFLLQNIPLFHHYYWRFWNWGWDYFWPSALILIGLLIIFRQSRKKNPPILP